MMILNWSAFSGNPQLEQIRCCFTAMSIFMLVMMIVMGGNSDILGHLGGAIYGFLLRMVAFPRPRTDQCRKWRLGCLLMIASLTVLCLGLLFGMDR